MKYSRAYVEITNICNRSCSFCPGSKREKRRMTEKEFAVVLEKLSNTTEYIYYHLMGEPTTHPKLCDFIRMANGSGYKSAVTTNGTLLNKVGDKLIESGVYKVNISVHSFEEGSAEEHMEYISHCLDFAEKASENGVLCVLRLWNNGFEEEKNGTVLNMLKHKFPEGEWSYGKRGIRLRHKLHLEYGDRFAWPDMAADNMGDEVFCYGLRDHFGILCDGSVVPCCLDHEGDIVLGNIFTEEIDAVLNSPRAENICRGFDVRHATEELCRRCGYARRFG